MLVALRIAILQRLVEVYGATVADIIIIFGELDTFVIMVTSSEDTRTDALSTGLKCVTVLSKVIFIRLTHFVNLVVLSEMVKRSI